MGTAIQERRSFSDKKFEQLREQLKDAPEICGERACIYATGSFGRREASEFSDVDLFIVSLGVNEGDPLWLRDLDCILVKADLIRATKELKFPPFSKDGRFLNPHTLHRLIAKAGTDEDDATNTFTARLLLLLESQPLVGTKVHARIIDDVIAKYWKEFPTHTDHFMPAYLANDILRYWRTLCLNYEARTSERTPEDQAKRKLANYKLKHNRMLTCFSALLFLLDVYVKHGTVTVLNAKRMVSMTPTERVASVTAGSTNERLIASAGELLALYEKFLTVTNASEDDLVRLFSNEDQRKKLRQEQSRFGDLVFEALQSIGDGNRFYRRLVV